MIIDNRYYQIKLIFWNRLRALVVTEMSQYQVEWWGAMLEGSVQRGRSPWKHSSEQILRTVLTKDQIQNCSPKKQTSDWFQIPRPILMAKFKKYFARVIFKRRTTFSIDITVQLCIGPLYDEDNNFFVCSEIKLLICYPGLSPNKALQRQLK